jgi:hypothetical protein
MKTWTNIDKSKWGRGEWQDEPDKVQWVDEATGLTCLAVRTTHGGHWCGYVGVPEDHPFHGKGYDAVDADVHGGLTFADKCRPSDKGEGFGICHVAGPGEPEVWWLGFDCAHSGDLSPRHASVLGEVGAFRDGHESYKPLGYVRDECASLAAQLVQP